MLTTLLFLQYSLPADGGREGDSANTYSSSGKDENTVIWERRREDVYVRSLFLGQTG